MTLFLNLSCKISKFLQCGMKGRNNRETRKYKKQERQSNERSHKKRIMCNTCVFLCSKEYYSSYDVTVSTTFLSDVIQQFEIVVKVTCDGRMCWSWHRHHWQPLQPRALTQATSVESLRVWSSRRTGWISRLASGDSIMFTLASCHLSFPTSRLACVRSIKIELYSRFRSFVLLASWSLFQPDTPEQDHVSVSSNIFTNHIWKISLMMWQLYG